MEAGTNMDRSRPTWKDRIGRWAWRLGLVAVVLASAELTCRLDDAIHLDVPLLANPDHERDLMLREVWGIRGKPGGRFQKWKLNEFGFRGPEIAREPVDGTTRILILGASETFGLLEGPDMEFPAQLGRELKSQGNFEVINAGIAGSSLRAMVSLWDNWGARFQPHIVLFYPTPIFYLQNEPPGPLRPYDAAREAQAATEFHLRLGDRLLGTYRTLPLWVRNIRRDMLYSRQIAGKSPDWFFSGVPQDRLDLFENDAARLIERIQDAGAIPIVVTHATSAVSPPRPEDNLHLRNIRFDFPRTTNEVIAAFEVEANDALRRIADRKGVRLIDAGRELGGERKLFGDLVHFTDAGAARMASLLAPGIVEESAAQRHDSNRAKRLEAITDRRQP